jgi:predicted dehydrogenase
MIAYADYQELLNHVDIVDICTPTSRHRPMVVEAARGPFWRVNFGLVPF